jgi:hypothetical protein
MLICGRTDQDGALFSFQPTAVRIPPLAGHEGESHDAQSDEAINHIKVTSHQLYFMYPCALDYDSWHQALRKHEEWRCQGR